MFRSVQAFVDLLFAYMELQASWIQSAEQTTRRSVPKHSQAANCVSDVETSTSSDISFRD